MVQADSVRVRNQQYSLDERRMIRQDERRNPGNGSFDSICEYTALCPFADQKETGLFHGFTSLKLSLSEQMKKRSVYR